LQEYAELKKMSIERVMKELNPFNRNKWVAFTFQKSWKTWYMNEPIFFVNIALVLMIILLLSMLNTSY
jgi:hypothetical protein